MGNVLHRRKAFRGGGGPVDEANLEAQWMGDGSVYNTGTTQATDGQTVATWVDETGNGHDVTQGTAGDKPLFQTSEQNGLPGIEFVSSDFLAKGSAILTAGPFTVYVVAKTSTSGSEQTLVNLPDNTTGTRMFTSFLNASLDLVQRSRSGGSFDATTTSSASTNTTFLFTGTENSGSTGRDVFLDGASQGSNTGTLVPTGINNFALGMARDSSPGQPLIGFIYEVRLYNVKHDTTTREAVEAQLNSKWGL